MLVIDPLPSLDTAVEAGGKPDLPQAFAGDLVFIGFHALFAFCKQMQFLLEILLSLPHLQ